MNATGPKKGAKIILKLLILTWRPALRKNQGGPSNREKLRECFILDSGCTGWQNTPQNLLNINLPNLVGWLQETLRKEQKLFRSDTFQLDGKFLKKKTKHYKKKKNSENALYLILSTLVGRARPKLWSISIYQTWFAGCNRP